MAGDLTGDATLLAAALVANLVALTSAVAELRQAQQHAAQAAAAHSAAQNLHAVMTHARSRMPHPSEVHTRRHARSDAEARPAEADFPEPSGHGVLLSAGLGSSPTPHRVRPLSPRRARPGR